MKTFQVPISDQLARTLEEHARQAGVDASALVAKWIAERFDASRTSNATDNTRDREHQR